MADLLRDLVVEEKVTVFIDNMMVATEMEERYDEIVEEVLRKLEENDLFVKPEKCVWKIREVGFLGVIIGEDRVRMENEKVQGVIEWLVLKKHKGCTEVFGASKLLQIVCKRFCYDSKTIA